MTSFLITDVAFPQQWILGTETALLFHMNHQEQRLFFAYVQQTTALAH